MTIFTEEVVGQETGIVMLFVLEGVQGFTTPGKKSC